MTAAFRCWESSHCFAENHSLRSGVYLLFPNMQGEFLRRTVGLDDKEWQKLNDILCLNSTLSLSGWPADLLSTGLSKKNPG